MYAFFIECSPKTVDPHYYNWVERTHKTKICNTDFVVCVAMCSCHVCFWSLSRCVTLNDKCQSRSFRAQNVLLLGIELRTHNCCWCCILRTRLDFIERHNWCISWRMESFKQYHSQNYPFQCFLILACKLHARVFLHAELWEY